ncbi:transposase [Rhodoplanes sp. SY1]|uniref:IS66 family transposase n=1 Tax=Rhodoplanes sp. SY1 TaxID=3166646 RepID=UPI0038B61E84
MQKACAIGRRRPDLADTTIRAHARDLARERDRLLALEPTQIDANHLRASMVVDGRGKLLVFLTRRDIEPTNNVSKRALRPSVIFRKVTNGFRSAWGAKAYADICSVVATGRIHGQTPLASLRAALATAPVAAHA